jgi:hypothetical protein
MMVTARRLRSIGWMATLVVCVALVMVLAFRVNALRSQVHQSDAKIIALKQETMYLETEFETRANQQQLKSWNDVEFGYVAPVATQYLDNERQLASYAKPVEPDAPAPVRVASADDAVVVAAAFPAMVSPMTGRPQPSRPGPGQAESGQAESGQGASAEQAVGQAASPAVDHARPANDDGDAPRPKHKIALSGLAGLGDHLATVRHDHKPDGSKQAVSKSGNKPAKAIASAAKPAQKGKPTRPAVEKSAARAFAGRAVRPKDHLARAAARHTDTARADKGTSAGRPVIRFAFKDAKTVK